MQILDEHLKEMDDFDVHSHVLSLHTELSNLKKWAEDQRAENREKVLQYTAVNQLNAAAGLEFVGGAALVGSRDCACTALSQRVGR